MISRTQYSFSVLCCKVEERTEVTEVHKADDGQSEVFRASLGWFASFSIGGQVITLGWGEEKPEFAAGDRVKFTLRKEE